MSFITPDPPKPDTSRKLPNGQTIAEYNAGYNDMMAAEKAFKEQPEKDKVAAEENTKRQQDADRKIGRGGAVNLFTGGQGLLDDAPTARKVLLGY